MTRIKIHISNVKLPFYPPCEVKCRLQNRVSTGGSAGDGRIDDGVDLCFDLFLFLVLFICFGGCDLMVDSAAIVGVFFYIFYGDSGRNNFSGCCC